MNGRYYFKLADIEKATNKAWGSIIVSHQVVGMAINNGYALSRQRRKLRICGEEPSKELKQHV